MGTCNGACWYADQGFDKCSGGCVKRGAEVPDYAHFDSAAQQWGAYAWMGMTMVGTRRVHSADVSQSHDSEVIN